LLSMPFGKMAESTCFGFFPFASANAQTAFHSTANRQHLTRRGSVFCSVVAFHYVTLPLPSFLCTDVACVLTGFIIRASFHFAVVERKSSK